ncbi:MAG: hypothetical protein DME99_03940 [Verrucomicrobia bacterium]|nr:MAG: hypothetical protein DME99_03940 [Verrucomicrobiota bacterium]
MIRPLNKYDGLFADLWHSKATYTLARHREKAYISVGKFCNTFVTIEETAPIQTDSQIANCLIATSQSN